MKCLVSSLLNIKIGSAFPWVWVPFSPLGCAPWELCPAPIKLGQGPRSSQWVLCHKPQAQDKKKTPFRESSFPCWSQLNWKSLWLLKQSARFQFTATKHHFLSAASLSSHRHFLCCRNCFLIKKDLPVGSHWVLMWSTPISSRRSAGWM